MSKLLLLFLLFLVFVNAHSWVSCTNYDRSAGTDDEFYNSAKCTGFGRGWGARCQNTNNQFGADCGYDYRGNGATGFCPSVLTSSNYSAGYTAGSPMATYAPGQTVCLAWPAKNHVAAECANKFIPDHGTKIYMSGANPTSDPANAAALQGSGFTLVKDLGTNPGADAMIGFQNCPQFCSDNDKCLCTGCFTVPSNVQQGAVYSFFWVWAFNSDQDLYESCWEARISGNAVPVQSSATVQTTRTSATQTTAQTSRTSASTSAAQTTRTSTSQNGNTQTTQNGNTQTQNGNTETSTSQNGNCGDEVETCKSICKTAPVTKCSCEGGNLAVECAEIKDDSGAAILSFSLLFIAIFLL